MSRAEILNETASWSRWLDANDYIGKGPEPGRRLMIVSFIVDAAGVVCTFMGVIGLVSGVVGTIATWGGVFLVSLGFILAAVSAATVRRDKEAAEDVKLRIRSLNAELLRRIHRDFPQA